MADTNILKYIGSCPVCTKKLRAEDATVITQTPRGALIEADCKNCATSLMLTIFASMSRAVSWQSAPQSELVTLIGIVTDLTAGDAQRMLKKPTVTIDDVFSTHQHLR